MHLSITRAPWRSLSPLLVAAAALFAGCAAELEEPPVAELDLGGEQTLDRREPRAVHATVRYADGTAAVAGTEGALALVVDDPSVARVDAEGRLEGLAIGVTTLHATYRGASASARVVVAR